MVFLIAIYLASISTYKVEDVIPPQKNDLFQIENCQERK